MDFEKDKAEVLQFLEQSNQIEPELIAKVASIIEDVRRDKDKALKSLTAVFDGAELDTFIVSEKERTEAYENVDPDFVGIVRQAIANIRSFHEKQLTNSWFDASPDGTILGQMVNPIDRVGLYVPGGTAAYPSSVLMNAIPAQVAGVPEIVMCAPPAADGKLNPYTLVAACEAGISEIWKLGGAQAVAAMAYGTETLRNVDKIVGPGNIYVTIAKKLVFGQVDIDMLAGPSEVMVIADETADPQYVAADLLSQAEHDKRAGCVLVSTSQALAQAVCHELEIQAPQLPRRDIVREAMKNRGTAIIVKDRYEAASVANLYAPEHLEISTSDPMELLGHIRHAGAVFMGKFSPEPVGDYYAGTNHVLPTGGTARFYSGLNVNHFRKNTSLIYYSEQRLLRDGENIMKFARCEGLEAHANAVAVRLKRS